MNAFKKKIIPLNIPYLKGSEKKLVLDCLRTNWVSSVGPYVTKFENKFKKFIGKFVILPILNINFLYLQ